VTSTDALPPYYSCHLDALIDYDHVDDAFDNLLSRNVARSDVAYAPLVLTVVFPSPANTFSTLFPNAPFLFYHYGLSHFGGDYLYAEGCCPSHSVLVYLHHVRLSSPEVYFYFVLILHHFLMEDVIVIC